MLSVEEWQRLYETNDRLERKRRSTGLSEEEKAELNGVEEQIERHSDGSDPLAPWGGIPFHKGVPVMDVFFLLHGFRCFRSSQRHRRRWVFFSLAFNGCLLLGFSATYRFWRAVVNLLDYPTPDRVTAATTELRLDGGAFALIIVAWAVLCWERHARRAECSRRRVAAVSAVTPDAAETRVPVAAISSPASEDRNSPLISQRLN
jgi:hypothetical protein